MKNEYILAILYKRAEKCYNIHKIATISGAVVNKGKEEYSMTIYDIAKEAGVSASSVSRVINKKPGVNPKTRERIEALLKKYNFTLNETARGLVTQSTRLIGILITDIRTMHYTDGAYFIQHELAGLGYCCILINTGDDPETQTDNIRMLEQRRVEAAVLIGSSFQTPTVERAIQQYLPEIPILMLNGYLELPNVYGILTDEKNGIKECVRLLAGKGRRKIAYVWDSESPSGKLKLAGYRAGVQEAGIAAWEYEAGGMLQDGYRTTQSVLAEHPDVDGIIYSIDLIAAGGIRALRDAGREVPLQVAVTGVDNSLYGELCYPKLTSLDNKLADMSIAGVRTLLDCLEGRRAVKKMMLFPSINEREST